MISSAAMLDRIRAFVLEELVKDAGLELGRDDPIFSAGLADSFAVVRLIAFLELELGVTIDRGGVSLEDFDTLAKIEAIAARARAG